MSASRPMRPLVVIVGPTGSGKSQLAVSLARHYNGEIINGDALQIYKGLPITTNKISESEQEGIPHHLLGSIGLEEEPWTVKQFLKKAQDAIEAIRLKGKLPIVVGGTQYYVQSLLVPNAVVEDSQSRFLTPQEQAARWPILEAPTQKMIDELRRVDPAMADRWHPKDRRKIRRSLEIWLQTGKPASHVYQEQLKTTSQDDSFPPAEHFESSVLDDHLVFWTHASARELHPRLDRRVDEMISRGLVEEVKSMHEFSQESRTQGLTVDQGRGIWIAIGYKELLPFLSHPKPSTTDKVQCVERIKLSTRQYAKRQSRWMRLRMLPALRQVRKDGFLFLLDASDPSTWSSTVEALAIDILRKFLDGRRLPMPDSLSQLARESLVVEEKPAMLAQYCEACDKTLMCEAEWTQHLKGRGHRKATQPRNSHHSQFLKVGDP